MVVVIRSNVRQVTNRLNHLNINFQRDIPEAGFEFCRLAQRNLRLALTKRGLIWRKKAWNSIQCRKKTRTKSELVMSQAAVFVDNMKPHWVKLKRGRLIRQWAREKGTDRVKSVALREGSIFVKPHPYINDTLAGVIDRLPIVVRSKIQKAMRGA